MGGISIWQIIIILLVIVLLFGMGKLPALAKDLGKALKVFRSSVDGKEETKGEGKNKKEAYYSKGLRVKVKSNSASPKASKPAKKYSRAKKTSAK